MSLDLNLFSSKVRRYREQLQIELQELASATGIDRTALERLETGVLVPTGDQVLILADFYQCDYKFLISNEQLAPFEQTENLYRRYGNEFQKEDRRRVQEFLFLCECEQYLQQELGKAIRDVPHVTKKGAYFKGHAEQAAVALRRHLGYSPSEIPLDVYEDFRRLGCHVFRRELENSNISGLFIRHPTAGRCLLVNYSEDVYRQRFSVTHEAGHAFLDDDEEVVVSFQRWSEKDLREIRANTFASRFLLPPEFLRQIPDSDSWSLDKCVEWAAKLRVSTEALSIALREANLVSASTQAHLKSARVPSEAKNDPELPDSLSPRSRQRKEEWLRRGLSNYYVNLSFTAYDQALISAARMAEMLLVSEGELTEFAALFGRTLEYAH